MREHRKSAANGRRAASHASSEAFEASNVREIGFEGSKTCANIAKALQTAAALPRTRPARPSRPQTCAKLALKGRKHARTSQKRCKRPPRCLARVQRGLRGLKRARNWL